MVLFILPNFPLLIMFFQIVFMNVIFALFRKLYEKLAHKDWFLIYFVIILKLFVFLIIINYFLLLFMGNLHNFYYFKYLFQFYYFFLKV